MYYNGKKLCNAIAQRQQSARAFAREAGVSTLCIYRAMTGGKASVRTLGKIANALNVSTPTDLLRTSSANKKG